VVYGILGTALAQGILAGIGFMIAGVPGALLLGLLTFFLSIVPMGPPLLWIPAAGWLYYQGDTGMAIFLVLWGALVVSSVDNFLKPYLISQGAAMPFILVLFGVLGGLAAFGFLGVFLGPTLLAVGFSLLRDWTLKPVSA
jgi:predicted PurR-regulated permease PerM